MTTRILHVIVGLDTGGAEKMLSRLIESHADNPQYEHIVVSLTSLGSVGRDLSALGVPIHILGVRSIWDGPVAFVRLVALIRRIQPTIVQTWMYHADLVGGLAARVATSGPVIWGIRSSAARSFSIRLGWLGRWLSVRPVVMVNAVLSHFIPAKIVCCGVGARASHADVGFDTNRMVVITNGYLVSTFDPSLEARARARGVFGIGEDKIVVGICGRFNAVKGYQYFVKAASAVAAKYPRAVFLMVGREVEPSNRALARWIDDGGFADRFMLVGERRDVPVCMAAMDVLCSSSIREGFPNVICEAMATGVPCVVSDVGDAAEIVDMTGIVTPSGDHMALAAALTDMVEMGHPERRRLGALARERILERFSMEVARTRFEAVYESVTH